MGAACEDPLIYERLWRDFLRAYADASAAAQALRLAESSAFPSLSEYSLALRWDPTQTREDDRYVANAIVGRLVMLAEQTLARPNVRLKIDSDPLLARWLGGAYDNWEVLRERFSPAAIWAELEQQYGGAKADELGFRQAANDIADYLNLRRNLEVRRVAGCVEVEASMWTEAHITKPGLRAVSYHSRERLERFVPALQAFVAWEAGASAEAALEDLRELREFATDTARSGFESRRRFGGQQFEFTCFKQKLRIRIRQPMADRLNEFLGQYATNLNRD